MRGVLVGIRTFSWKTRRFIEPGSVAATSFMYGIGDL